MKIKITLPCLVWELLWVQMYCNYADYAFVNIPDNFFFLNLQSLKLFVPKFPYFLFSVSQFEEPSHPCPAPSQNTNEDCALVSIVWWSYPFLWYLMFFWNISCLLLILCLHSSCGYYCECLSFCWSVSLDVRVKIKPRAEIVEKNAAFFPYCHGFRFSLIESLNEFLETTD